MSNNLFLTRYRWDGNDYTKSGTTSDEVIHSIAVFEAMKTKWGNEGGLYKYVLHSGLAEDYEYIDSFKSIRNDLLP